MVGRWEGRGLSAKVDIPACQSGLREDHITEALRVCIIYLERKEHVRAIAKQEEYVGRDWAPSLRLTVCDHLVKHSAGLAPLANASRGKHWEETWHRAMRLGLD